MRKHESMRPQKGIRFAKKRGSDMTLNETDFHSHSQNAPLQSLVSTTQHLQVRSFHIDLQKIGTQVGTTRQTIIQRIELDLGRANDLKPFLNREVVDELGVDSI